MKVAMRTCAPWVLVALLLVATGCSSQDPAKTPRPLPSGAPGAQPAAPVKPASGAYAFHINLTLDESVACGEAQCDLPYLTKWILYVRGTVNIAPTGEVSGDGVMRVADLGRCATSMVRVSSCGAEPAQDGKFSIAGTRTPTGIQVMLREAERVGLKVTHRTKTPSGPMEIPFDSTYDSLIHEVLVQAGILDTAVDLQLPAGGARTSFQPARVFEGRWAQRMRTGTAVHSIHAFGSWMFVDPKLSLPERAAPR